MFKNFRRLITVLESIKYELKRIGDWSDYLLKEAKGIKEEQDETIQ